MESEQALASAPPRRPSIKWQGHEYVHSEKSADWFWTLGIIAVAAAVAAILFGNALFALLILLGAGVAGMYAARHPDEVTFELSNKGLRTDDTLFPYGSLDAFWIDDEDPDDDIPPKLILRSKKVLMPLLIVPIPFEIPQTEVRALLLQYLPETRLEEPVAHKLMERLGL